YWFNTALFFLIDLRRFEPAQKPILELTSVYFDRFSLFSKGVIYTYITPFEKRENRFKRTQKSTEPNFERGLLQFPLDLYTIALYGRSNITPRSRREKTHLCHH
ncbi:MAG TPA: hypothetical protein VGO47_05400, partial [Chlamydiales bacterium]|nr:hypothetical protein [Chlamydiales bacterium]